MLCVRRVRCAVCVCSVCRVRVCRCAVSACSVSHVRVRQCVVRVCHVVRVRVSVRAVCCARVLVLCECACEC